jgi:hypothetical protein
MEVEGRGKDRWEEKIGSSLFLVGEQLLQVSSTQSID